MQLFSNIDHIESLPRIAGLYQNFNQQLHPEMEVARQRFQKWFNRFPEAAQKAILPKFVSNDDKLHVSAFTEIAVHEALFQSKYSVEYEQKVANGTRPDFKVSSPNGLEAFVEVCCTLDLPPSRETFKQRMLELIDYLNNNLDVVGFGIFLHVHKITSTPKPPLKSVVTFLNETLNSLVTKKSSLSDAKRHGFCYRQNGWFLEFSAIKIPDDSELAGATSRIYGNNSENLYSFYEHEPVREALIKKLKNTERLMLP